MKYLLDTSIWLRAVAEPDTLPADALTLLGAGGELFGLAAISLWEVGKKAQIGKIEIPKDLHSWFTDALGTNIHILPLSEGVIVDAMGLPEFPNRDPADELIVATARVHNLTLLTTDTLLRGYRHARIRYFKPILKVQTAKPVDASKPRRRPASK